MQLRLSALAAVFVLAGCGGASITVPTAPPAQPTPATQPTPDVPQPTDNGVDGTLPPDAATRGACRLMTLEEVGGILGEAVTVTEMSETSCTWSAAMFLPSINLRFESGESIAAAKMILTNPVDVTVGGQPAVYGEFMGSLLYVEKGGQTLVLQAIWGEEGETAKAKLLQMGEIAVSRF